MVVVNVVLAARGLLNISVRPRHRNVVSDSDVAIGAPPNLDLVVGTGVDGRSGRGHFQVLCVDDIKDLLGFRAERLKDDKVSLRGLHLHDVHNLVVVADLEGKVDLAELAVQLLEFDHGLLAMDFSSALGLQPVPQTLQVDPAHGPCATTWGNEGVDVVGIRSSDFGVLPVLLSAPANAAHCLRFSLVGLAAIFMLAYAPIFIVQFVFFEGGRRNIRHIEVVCLEGLIALLRTVEVQGDIVNVDGLDESCASLDDVVWQVRSRPAWFGLRRLSGGVVLEKIRSGHTIGGLIVYISHSEPHSAQLDHRVLVQLDSLFLLRLIRTFACIVGVFRLFPVVFNHVPELLLRLGEGRTHVHLVPVEHPETTVLR